MRSIVSLASERGCVRRTSRSIDRPAIASTPPKPLAHIGARIYLALGSCELGASARPPLPPYASYPEKSQIPRIFPFNPGEERPAADSVATSRTSRDIRSLQIVKEHSGGDKL